MKATVYIALISLIAWLSLPVQADNNDGSGPPVAQAVQGLDAAIENFGKTLTPNPAQSAPAQTTSETSVQESAAVPPAAATNLPAASSAAEAKTAQNFGAPIVFVYEFGAAWCPSCRKLAPIVEEATNKYGSFAEYIPVNVDKNQDLVQKLNVAQIPTVMILDRRGRMLNRLVGLQQGKQIDVILEHYKSQAIATATHKVTQ